MAAIPRVRRHAVELSCVKVNASDFTSFILPLYIVMSMGISRTLHSIGLDGHLNAGFCSVRWGYATLRKQVPRWVHFVRLDTRDSGRWRRQW